MFLKLISPSLKIFYKLLYYKLKYELSIYTTETIQKSLLRYKGTRIEELFYGVPNINDRAEIIERALTKNTDCDFTKLAFNHGNQ